MEQQGKLTILIGEEGTTIEVIDPKSSLLVVKLKVTPIGFQKALSRQAYVDCDVFYNQKAFDKIGKTMVMDKFSFEIPSTTDYGNRKEVAKEIALLSCPKGWIPDLGFNSQDSFTNADGKTFARCIIRKWEDAQ